MESELAPMNDQPTPAEALDLIRKSRNAVRAAVSDGKAALRYALIYSAIVGVMVGGQVLDLPFNVVCSAGGVLGLALLAKTWSDRTGIWISGVSPRRARWVAIGPGAVLLVLTLVGVHFGRQQQIWAGIPLGLAAFAIAMAGSWLWIKVFLAETREP
jgi:hypothetical protein